MESDASSIEDVEPRPVKNKIRFPVWQGKSQAEIYALIEEGSYDAPAKKIAAEKSTGTPMQDDASPIDDVEPRPVKKYRGPPVWHGRRTFEEKPPLPDKPNIDAPANEIAAGNPPEEPSKGRQVRQQVAHDKGPKEAFEENSDCNTLLERCRLEAEKATTSEDEASRNVEMALAGIAELKRLVAANPAAEEELLQAYDAAGIRITKRTANQFTPLVKLVFPKKAQKPATVSRYASVLRFAEEENIKTNGFVDFVRRNGGLAACASRASENRRNSVAGSRQAGTRAAEALIARRRNAPRLQLPPGIVPPKGSPIALLVEPGPKGSWLILGYRRAPAGAVASFSPVSAGRPRRRKVSADDVAA